MPEFSSQCSWLIPALSSSTASVRAKQRFMVTPFQGLGTSPRLCMDRIRSYATTGAHKHSRVQVYARFKGDDGTFLLGHSDSCQIEALRRSVFNLMQTSKQTEKRGQRRLRGFGGIVAAPDSPEAPVCVWRVVSAVVAVHTLCSMLRCS